MLRCLISALAVLGSGAAAAAFLPEGAKGPEFGAINDYGANTDHGFEVVLPPDARTILSDFAALDSMGYDIRGGPHGGIDIHLPRGFPVIAAHPGVVQVAEHDRFKGYTITLKNETNPMVTEYWHLRDLFVHKGDQVARGQIIGTVGNSGSSAHGDVPHLHFEARDPWGDRDLHKYWLGVPDVVVNQIGREPVNAVVTVPLYNPKDPPKEPPPFISQINTYPIPGRHEEAYYFEKLSTLRRVPVPLYQPAPESASGGGRD